MKCRVAVVMYLLITAGMDVGAGYVADFVTKYGHSVHCGTPYQGRYQIHSAIHQYQSGMNEPLYSISASALPDGSSVTSILKRADGTIEQQLIVSLAPDIGADFRVHYEHVVTKDGEEFLRFSGSTIFESKDSASMCHVQVLGAVNKPGEVQYSSHEHMTLAEAITRAGGFTPDAISSEVQVISPDMPNTTEGMGYRRIVDAGKILNKEDIDTILRVGDIVLVPPVSDLPKSE